MSESKGWSEIRRTRMPTREAQVGYDRARRAYELGKQIRALRTTAGLTQKELAERMGSTQSVVARLEGGGVFPTIETLERVAAALGAQLDIALHAEFPNASASSDSGREQTQSMPLG
jgi:transcriptional regulator with XRE-family HTH domain